MNAILSGQSALAVCIENNQIYSINLNTPESWIERHEWEIPRLFPDAIDILHFENISKSEVLDKLEFEWAQDRSLQLTLILLDPEEELQTRIEAAECLNDFFYKEEMKKYVGNFLYSSPLPSISDLNGAIQLSADASLKNVTEFLVLLRSDQEEILKRFDAWEALPISVFGDLTSKREFYYEAVRHGAFRIFVTERQKKDLAIFQLLSHPHFRGSRKAREIFQMWAAPFRESITNIEFENRDIEDDPYDTFDNKNKKRSIDSFNIFQQVEKQREAIKKLLKEGKKELAIRFTEQLIDNQRLNSEPTQTAKSLCDLAQFAKRMGSPDLQLEFALKAVKEAPNDSWSHATLGDAYRALAEFQKALESYQTTGVLGNVCVALTGRAEILKELGQFDEAIKIYEQCIEQFPDELVPRNGRAAALAHYGELEQALDAYDIILGEMPFDAVTKSGHAQVLRDMGRLNDAFKEFNMLSEFYPEEIIPQCARIEVLRELGNLEEAMSASFKLVNRFPLSSETRVLYAKILRDLGLFGDALAEYNKIIAEFPLNPFAYLGIAETYRKTGKLSEALEAYERIKQLFPRVNLDRNGKASVLVAMGDYPNALRILPTNLPATQSEWVAYHIQGMAQMRSGRLDKAEKVFEWGLKETPWESHRLYFKTALASLRVQQRRYQEVFPLIREINHPSIKPIVHTLIMHASGELMDTFLFDQSYKSIKDTSAPCVIELREALAVRYKWKSNLIQKDDWFFIHECDSLLLAA